MLPLLGDALRSPTGRTGYFAMRMYSVPPWESAQAPFDSFELDDTNIVLYDYNHPAVRDNVLYATITADIVFEASDTYTFGLTVSGTARLFLDDKLVVDNSETQTRGDSFFGSGSIEEIGSVLVEGGRVYNLRVDFGSAATSQLNKSGAPIFGAGGVRIGCGRRNDETTDLNKALSVAAAADQVVLCVGLGPEWESEGSDRTTMSLPGLQSDLISEIVAINPNVVVVIQAGSPVSGPWDQVPAVLQTWYGGNESGFAVADILLGKSSPSGRLPVSWPKAIEDTPAFLSHHSEAGRCYYSEDVYVGYRYYEKTKRGVQWPFGHGLSYAAFLLSDMKLELKDTVVDGQLQVSLWVTNISKSVDGSEVCQAYVQRNTPSVVSRPVKELKGFSKVFVRAGESKLVRMSIPIKYAVSVWDETADSWLMESGQYTLFVGNSSAFTPLQLDFTIESSYLWQGL
jgi:beta-glucosidase